MDKNIGSDEEGGLPRPANDSLCLMAFPISSRRMSPKPPPSSSPVKLMQPELPSSVKYESIFSPDLSCRDDARALYIERSAQPEQPNRQQQGTFDQIEAGVTSRVASRNETNRDLGNQVPQASSVREADPDEEASGSQLGSSSFQDQSSRRESIGKAKMKIKNKNQAIQPWVTYQVVGLAVAQFVQFRQLMKSGDNTMLPFLGVQLLLSFALIILLVLSYKRAIWWIYPTALLQEVQLVLHGFYTVVELQLGGEAEMTTLKHLKYMVMFMLSTSNALVCYQIIQNSIVRKVFFGLSFGLSFGSISITYITASKTPLSGLALLRTLFLLSLILFVFFGVVRTLSSLESVYVKEILRQRKQNELFRRIINQIQEATIVVENKKIKFQNSVAEKLALFEGEEDAAEEKFFPFGQGGGMTNQSMDGKSEMPVRGLTLRDALNLRKENQGQIYTLSREVAESSSLNQVDLVLKFNKGFTFFLIKLIELSQLENEHADEPIYVIQLIDISQKMLSDSLSLERKYLAYMNSTISHEMRNPLNSITAQIEVFTSLIERLKQDLDDGVNPEAIFEEFQESLHICEASSKMLQFNVEDILALPQLKEGRFTKNIAPVCALDAVKEVMRIQSYQARKKLIRLDSATRNLGPDGKMRVLLDEKRFQQVVLNYQSNALKFINRKEGRVQLFLQRVPQAALEGQESKPEPIAVQHFREIVSQFYGFDFVEEAARKKDTDEDPYQIFQPDLDSDKLVLSVLDNGVGIREADQQKLFKLFGKLSSTKRMNTQGIGLGLLITKMISEEFGGMVQVLSAFQHGSIFQSCFLLQSFDGQAPSLLNINSPNRGREAPTFKDILLRSKNVQFERCLTNFREPPSPTERRILIVDDESFNVEALLSMMKILQLKKEAVDYAFNGHDGLSLLRKAIKRTDGRASCNYAIVFMDCSMPFMDGFECATKMNDQLTQRGVDSEEDRPEIVAVTGHVEEEYQEKAVKSGMKNMFCKPLKILDLASILMSHGYRIKVPPALVEKLEAETS